MIRNKTKNCIRVGILGYGNLGRGVEMAIQQNSDMQLAGIFTRRNPASILPLTEASPIYSVNALMSKTKEVDVMILCGGSAVDLCAQSPVLAQHFNIVDSYDTHPKIPGHFEAVHHAALAGSKLALVSIGWDPGLFSLNRLYAEAVLPMGSTYTFWGDGVSQGHSDALRCIDGVENAIQYTLPIKKALQKVRSGSNPIFTAREKHKRLCYVVAAKNADKKRIQAEIIAMPDYFADYDTTVKFISEETLEKDHHHMPHGGFVLRSGTTGNGANEEASQVYEFSLKLDSNPQFTASVLTAYARATARLAACGEIGARTVFDIPPSYLSSKTAEELRRDLL